MSSKLSFVIPCYRSEATIQNVTDEIIEVVSQRDDYDYEIICVNDQSPDNVYQVLKKLAAENMRIKVVGLARNMGKHAAVLAGYRFVTGDYIVNLDDDCQCPTNELWKLLELVEKDECDVATASYVKKKQAAWKNIGSNINLLMGAIMLEKPVDLRFENFSVMKRFVVDEAVKYAGPYPYLEGLILRVTRRIKAVEMEQRNRGDDQVTGYTFKKSLALFINGFTAFSVKPLRISTFIGFLAATLGFLSGIIMTVRKLMNPAIVMGYTSIVVILLFLGGLILMSLGLLGEYVGRIYICINGAPQYVIIETFNMETDSSRDTIKD